ncbi:MAG: T9SS type A sorting domain-containing protein [Siphonobacter sp.]
MRRKLHPLPLAPSISRCLESGLYILQISSGDQIQRLRVMKE